MMTCSQCHKQMPDRYEQFNGHTIKYEICLECERENNAKLGSYPKENRNKKSVAKKPDKDKV